MHQELRNQHLNDEMNAYRPLETTLLTCVSFTASQLGLGLFQRANIEPSSGILSRQVLIASMTNPFATDRIRINLRALLCVACLLMLSLSGVTRAQDAFNEADADPVKLFERGQNAHARGDLKKALEFYEEAIKVRPEFPEAEFQRSSVLMALGRLDEAESGLRHAIELKKNWALPHAALGTLLVRLKREREAETSLREAIKLDDQNNLSMRLLAEIRLRAGDAKEAVELSRRATKDPDAPLTTWLLRAIAERTLGDNIAALSSLDHLLKMDARNLAALIERAEIHLANGEKETALSDLAAADSLLKDDKEIGSRLAAAYEKAGKPDAAQRVAKSVGLIDKQVSLNTTGGVVGTPEETEGANSADPEVAVKALENLLIKNPKNAMLLARLGDLTRKSDPSRSLEFYSRAVQIEPDNANYATGYSSALVQVRRFAEAVAILRRVIAKFPDNYAAHANLATALYSLKAFPDALAEYQWLLSAKPDLSITHYFIATSHDNLGQYEQALASYELFLAKANQNTNELEIEKVKLRLPSLRRQIQLGQGVKTNEKNRKH